MERVMRNKLAIAVFLLPSLVLFIAIVIVPIFMSAGYSLTQWNGVTEKIFIGIDNYIKLFGDKVFLGAMKNSFVFAAASVCIQLPLSLVLALVLANRVKAERFFVTVYFIPVILAAVVIGQLWMRVYNQKYGILNFLLKAMGFDELGSTVWLGKDGTTALIAVMVAVLWQYVGYHMLLFYSGINSISTDIYEAAKIDGASFWNTSFRITIPLLKEIIAVSMTFAVVGSMKVYDMVKIMTDGGPYKSTEVLTTLLVHTMFYPGNSYGEGSAISIVLIVECFALYLIVKMLFRDRDGRRLGRRIRNG